MISVPALHLLDARPPPPFPQTPPLTLHTLPPPTSYFSHIYAHTCAPACTYSSALAPLQHGSRCSPVIHRHGNEVSPLPHEEKVALAAFALQAPGCLAFEAWLPSLRLQQPRGWLLGCIPTATATSWARTGRVFPLGNFMYIFINENDAKTRGQLQAKVGRTVKTTKVP